MNATLSQHMSQQKCQNHIQVSKYFFDSNDLQNTFLKIECTL